MSYSILVELMKKTGKDTGIMWELTVRGIELSLHKLQLFYELVNIFYRSISQDRVWIQSFIHILLKAEATLLLFAGNVSRNDLWERNRSCLSWMK